ncbi:MAG: addiction module toxin RelE [Blastopirellula sp.]|nr:MAG: addiction module toxin RelE [Blastopirellula sp.]
MRVISKARLIEFWARHSKAEAPLTHWHNHVKSKSTEWKSYQDVKKDFDSVDKVDDCYVFDIGGNNFRLIAKIVRECVYVLKIMTHKEYDRQKWIVECRCLIKLKKDVAKSKIKTRRKK